MMSMRVVGTKKEKTLMLISCQRQIADCFKLLRLHQKDNLTLSFETESLMIMSQLVLTAIDNMFFCFVCDRILEN